MRAEAKGKRKGVGPLAGFLAVWLTLTFTTVLFALLWPVVAHQREPSQLVVFLVGNLAGTVLGVIVGYFFISTAGSRRKDEIIAQAPPIQGDVPQ